MACITDLFWPYNLALLTVQLLLRPLCGHISHLILLDWLIQTISIIELAIFGQPHQISEKSQMFLLQISNNICSAPKMTLSNLVNDVRILQAFPS